MIDRCIRSINHGLLPENCHYDIDSDVNKLERSSSVVASGNIVGIIFHVAERGFDPKIP
jgi:hypothetical protein